MKPFKDLDPILHSQLRLAVVSILISVKEAEFTYIREKTEATAGNLSVQITKLKDAGYITAEKRFRDNYPQTICRITEKGTDAFETYVKALKDYLKLYGSGSGRRARSGSPCAAEARRRWRRSPNTSPSPRRRIPTSDPTTG